MEIAKITVPALLTKSQARVNMLSRTFLRFGRRYGGSSSTKGGGGDLSKVFFKIQATMMAVTIPSAYIPSINTAPSEIKPKTV